MPARYTADGPSPSPFHSTRRRVRARAGAVAALLVAALLAPPLVAPASAQDPPSTFDEALAALPFRIGELLEYDARLGPVRLGHGSMRVVGRERVREQDALRVSFRIEGGIPGFRVKDQLDSWFDPRTISSLRFVQELDEGPRERRREWEIFPERRAFQEKGKPEQPSVYLPLDDAAFLYYVRTVPLQVEQRHSWNRYFRPDRNPVQVTVVRRERITVPAGTFDTLVLRPTIRTNGILSESSKTELWLTDDARKMLVQMRSELPFGVLALQLRKAETGS